VREEVFHWEVNMNAKGDSLKVLARGITKRDVLGMKKGTEREKKEQIIERRKRENKPKKRRKEEEII
jgi:hypothetical protein